MARRRAELDFPSISIEGALFPADFLARIAHFEAAEQSENDYRVPKKLKLRDELGRYFRIAEGLWQEFQSLPTGKGRDARKLTVESFLVPFLRQVLGFEDITAVGTMKLDGRDFPIGHSAGAGRIPLVLASRDEDLDAPLERYGDEHRRRSPFLLAQEYLNAGAAQWAMVSNGRVLRLLRDNPSLTRPAYLEFDLQRLFEERLYPDFAVLWLTCHASRFGAIGASPSDCALERWKGAAQQEGTRARERLRFGVADALRELGTGFLSVPGNNVLRERIERGELTSEAFYQQLLRLIYRVLFLFTVEERGHIHPQAASPEAIELYRSGYSLANLRALASKRRRFDKHLDLWQALVITFGGLQKGEPSLGLPPLGGLFRPSECPDLDSADLPNFALLQSIYRLAFFVEDGALVRVNYRDMGSEELGSIYEALLEMVPEIDTASLPWRFRFAGDDAPAGQGAIAGNARKLTGSYYTPDSLVQELIKSALEPIIADRLDSSLDPETAILGIKVIDPACGSGHFLLAAARRLAEHLASLRARNSDAQPADYRRALRDVVSHCIYGVDRNPLALELSRTALWLESFTAERPLGFLDHHLRCGDALVGVLKPEVIVDGVPEAAFDALSGDDKVTARIFAKANAAARLNLIREKERLALMQELAIYESDGGRVVEDMPEESLAQVEAKREAYELACRVAEKSKAKRLADIFIAAFFCDKVAGKKEAIPTTEDFHRVVRDVPTRNGIESSAKEVVKSVQAFHWYLEFPDVFEGGGFDVVLGNPPWERIKIQEQEFFATRDSEIANARNKAERLRLIQGLKNGSPAERALSRAFESARRRAEAASVFARDSGRYPLTGFGDVNTYALFAEAFLQLLRANGRAGLLTPTGIATDESTKRFFVGLVKNEKLVSLVSFYEVRAWFPGTDDRKSFCLLTIGPSSSPRFIFDVDTLEDLLLEEKWFVLTSKDFQLLNPNTETCPIFRSKYDADLTKSIYSRAGVFVLDKDERGNPWDVEFTTMFHMASDSGLFKPEPAAGRLPLYEGKMIHQFDHRWTTFIGRDDESLDVGVESKRDAGFLPSPRYWVDERQVLASLADVPRDLAKSFGSGDEDEIQAAMGAWIAGHLLTDGEDIESVGDVMARKYKWLRPLAENYKRWINAKGEVRKYRLTTDNWRLLAEERFPDCIEHLVLSRTPKWLLGWRDIVLRSVERTVVAAAIPRVAVGNTMPLLRVGSAHKAKAAVLLGNFNALVLDYVARQKIGGVHLTYNYLKQFPFLPPSTFDKRITEYITERVVELSYTSHHLKEFAADFGFKGHPFAFEDSRRAFLRAELDAVFARLYGLTKDELRYILDPAEIRGQSYPSETFRVLRDNEVRKFGEFRTRRLVLEAWDRLGARDSAESLQLRTS